MKVVLIVEDTDSVACSLTLAVESIAGIRAVVAHDPRAALRICGNGLRIAAVITDLNLPEMDGFELIDRLRSLEAYRDLPAIMITAEEDARAPLGFTRGLPNVILQKPFSPKEVCRVLESLLH